MGKIALLIATLAIHSFVISGSSNIEQTAKTSADVSTENQVQVETSADVPTESQAQVEASADVPTVNQAQVEASANTTDTDASKDSEKPYIPTPRPLDENAPPIKGKNIFDLTGVEKINIEYHPDFYAPFDLTQKDRIQKINDYFNNLDLIEISQPYLLGPGYDVTFSFEDGNEELFHLHGGQYLLINDTWYEMTYEQHVNFQSLCANFVLENFENSGEFNSVKGKIVSIKQFYNSDTDKECCIENNSQKYIINLRHDHHIVDMNGGRMALTKGDWLNIKYKEIKSNKIIPDTIFIVEKAPLP